MRDDHLKEEMRQALADRIGEDLQNRFANACVAVCGLGGLGSNIAISLARAGVGKLILVDFDRVDITNLNRQQYKVKQLGEYKADALRENLAEIAPYADVRAFVRKMDESNYEELLGDADIVCEAFDRAEEKSRISNFALENMPDKYLVAASGMAGLGSPNEIVTAKITEKFYLCGDGKSEATAGNGLFSARVMLCAAHQAQTVLRILAGEYEI